MRRCGGGRAAKAGGHASDEGVANGEDAEVAVERAGSLDGGDERRISQSGKRREDAVGDGDDGGSGTSTTDTASSSAPS